VVNLAHLIVLGDNYLSPAPGSSFPPVTMPGKASPDEFSGFISFVVPVEHVHYAYFLHRYGR
jgi:hypothetical protein